MNTLHSLFTWTLDVSLRASLLAGAVMLIQAALRGRISARWRYALWLPVLLVLVLPVLPESRWSWENVFVAHPPTPPAMTGSLPVAEPVSTAITQSFMMPPTPSDWKSVAAITWASGAMISLMLGIASYLAAMRRFKQQAAKPSATLLAMIRSLSCETGLRDAPRVIVSSAVGSPAVAGLLRHVLLLPVDFESKFTGPEIRLVLRHELMHLKRHDLPVNTLVCLLQAIHWFNPVLWFAASRVRADRESACDAQVLASSPHDCRNDYGHALLKVQTACARRGFSLGLVGIFGSARLMRLRIAAIANYRRAHPVMGMIVGALIGLLSLLGATRAETPARGHGTFEIGLNSFPFGDSIHIVSVQRDAGFITVHGEYELVSQAKASLDLYITSSDVAWSKSKMDPRQHLEVEKGKGTFTQVHPAPHPGMPHVTFYTPSTRDKPGQSFGGVYFGTKEEAEASKEMTRNYGVAADGRGMSALSTNSYAMGKVSFPFGDSIHIASVQGTAEALTVTGEYELLSEEKAALCLFITTTKNSQAKSKTDPRQRLEVKKGKGTFTLVHPAPYSGVPHVTFYTAKTHEKPGQPFGGSYFGTKEVADASKQMKLNYGAMKTDKAAQ